MFKYLALFIVSNLAVAERNMPTVSLAKADTVDCKDQWKQLKKDCTKAENDARKKAWFEGNDWTMRASIRASSLTCFAEAIELFQKC